MNTSMRSSRLASRNVIRSYFREQRRMNSDLPAPPLLLKLRGDLKEAMKKKDAARLSVLRAVLAEVTNAAKTNNPLNTDMKMVALLKKKAQSSKEAIAEFESARRSDLVDKETAQVNIMEEYVSTVKTMDDEEVKQIIQDAIGSLRTDGANPNIGTVAKELYKPGGPLDGKSVDRGHVTMLLKGML